MKVDESHLPGRTKEALIYTPPTLAAVIHHSQNHLYLHSFSKMTSTEQRISKTRGRRGGTTTTRVGLWVDAISVTSTIGKRLISELTLEAGTVEHLPLVI